MSVQALSCAFAVRGLSASEKLVLLALANFSDERMRCWPSQDRLAADTELSPRTVWGALKALEEKKVVSRESRKRADGTRASDVFTLHFSLTVRSEPVAKSAKSTRNSCENQSQPAQEPVAAVATLTTFEPSSNHQLEPSPESKEDEPAGFAEWWEVYPRKVAKGAARKAYRAALKKAKPEVLLASLKAHPFSAEVRYQPHPATWLNGECWGDAIGAEPRAFAPSPPDDDPWPSRLLRWRIAGYWDSEWGPKPDKPGYRGPEIHDRAA